MEDIIKTILVGALTAITIVAVLYALNCIYMGLKRKDFRSKSGIRVVKKGKIPTKKVECLHCHSIIEYDTMKVEYEQAMDKYFPYIICPLCNEQIMLGKENTQTTK
jgi:hypothetical protein